MDYSSAPTFSLDQFEGPIELLLRLVQSHELTIDGLSLSDLTKQCLEKLARNQCNLDNGAQFIATTATLLYLKSCHLLPAQKTGEEASPQNVDDPNFSILLHLIDYCRFKQAAQQLAKREQQQEAFYPRGTGNENIPSFLGIEHLELSDLSNLFSSIINKASPSLEVVEEELFKVSDKILQLRQELECCEQISFTELFSEQMTRLELIVIFLAILELMKCAHASVVRDVASGEVSLTHFR
jgi:segregation and condensation protein A